MAPPSDGEAGCEAAVRGYSRRAIQAQTPRFRVVGGQSTIGGSVGRKGVGGTDREGALQAQTRGPCAVLADYA